MAEVQLHTAIRSQGNVNLETADWAAQAIAYYQSGATTQLPLLTAVQQMGLPRWQKVFSIIDYVPATDRANYLNGTNDAADYVEDAIQAAAAYVTASGQPAMIDGGGRKYLIERQIDYGTLGVTKLEKLIFANIHLKKKSSNNIRAMDFGTSDDPASNTVPEVEDIMFVDCVFEGKNNVVANSGAGVDNTDNFFQFKKCRNVWMYRNRYLNIGNGANRVLLVGEASIWHQVNASHDAAINFITENQIEITGIDVTADYPVDTVIQLVDTVAFTTAEEHVGRVSSISWDGSKTTINLTEMKSDRTFTDYNRIRRWKVADGGFKGSFHLKANKMENVFQILTMNDSGHLHAFIEDNEFENCHGIKITSKGKLFGRIVCNRNLFDGNYIGFQTQGSSHVQFENNIIVDQASGGIQSVLIDINPEVIETDGVDNVAVRRNMFINAQQITVNGLTDGRALSRNIDISDNTFFNQGTGARNDAICYVSVGKYADVKFNRNHVSGCDSSLTAFLYSPDANTADSHRENLQCIGNTILHDGTIFNIGAAAASNTQIRGAQISGNTVRGADGNSRANGFNFNSLRDAVVSDNDFLVDSFGVGGYNVRLTDNRLIDSTADISIAAGSEYIYVENNQLISGSEAMVIAANCKHIFLRDNDLIASDGAIRMNGGGCEDIHITGNRITGNGPFAGGVFFQNAERVYVSDNMIRCTYYGIRVNDSNNTTKNIFLTGNTIYVDSPGGASIRCQPGTNDSVVNLHVTNNTMYNPNSIGLSIGTRVYGWVANGNSYQGEAIDTTGCMNIKEFTWDPGSIASGGVPETTTVKLPHSDSDHARVEVFPQINVAGLIPFANITTSGNWDAGSGTVGGGTVSDNVYAVTLTDTGNDQTANFDQGRFLRLESTEVSATDIQSDTSAERFTSTTTDFTTTGIAVGHLIEVAGFTQGQSNGTFLVTGVTANAIDVLTIDGSSDTNAGAATITIKIIALGYAVSSSYASDVTTVNVTLQDGLVTTNVDSIEYWESAVEVGLANLTGGAVDLANNTRWKIMSRNIG